MMFAGEKDLEEMIRIQQSCGIGVYHHEDVSGFVRGKRGWHDGIAKPVLGLLHWHPIWIAVQVQDARFLIRLFAYDLGNQWRVAQVLEPLYPCRRRRGNS